MNYSIEKATEHQMDLISDKYWNNSPKWQQNKYNYICFVATDSMSNIVGYIALEEKKIPIPPYGIDWFIETIMVLKPYRRCGIGSALLKQAFTVAQQSGVRNFQGSANPTKEAHAFWSKNKFCFFQYGKQHDNIEKREEYGNYSHIIFRRVNNVNICCRDTQTICRYKFDIANQEQINNIYSTYIENECVKFFHVNKDKINGIIASNESAENVGFITYLEVPLSPPLTGKQWYIPYLYVKPEARKKGLAKELIMKLIKCATENDIQQLLIIHPNEEIMPFWYELGFDIFIFRYLFSGINGKFPIGIGKNINSEI